MTKMKLPVPASLLGYFGVAPQFAALTLFWYGGEWGYLALNVGFFYPVLIFSFLGGIWWGQAVANNELRAKVYVMSVLPSLVGLALFLSWIQGWFLPSFNLNCIGFLVICSPLVDRFLGYGNKDFLVLRWNLSMGLGLSTFALGLLVSKATH
jgi:hypothetical protein